MEIDYERVTAVLLQDGWHRVKGRSFVIEPYRFAGVGVGAGSSAAAPGATWLRSKGHVISCPLSSILAVRYALPDEEESA